MFLSQLVSAGDDCKIRIWDTRKLGSSGAEPIPEPVKELGGKHSHWIWQARTSPYHDELLLSSSSDCQVRTRLVGMFISCAHAFVATVLAFLLLYTPYVVDIADIPSAVTGACLIHW